MIALGLMLAFIVAGTIEGFVTPSGLPTSMRIAIGVAVFVAFWTYVVVLGRRAASLGYTGAFGEHERLEKQRARRRAARRGAWGAEAPPEPPTARGGSAVRAATRAAAGARQLEELAEASDDEATTRRVP